MAKNTRKVTEFCQSEKMGTLNPLAPITNVFLLKTLSSPIHFKSISLSVPHSVQRQESDVQLYPASSPKHVSYQITKTRKLSNH